MMMTIKGFWFLMVLLPFTPNKPAWPAINIGVYEEQAECQMNIMRAFKTRGFPKTRSLPVETKMACLWFPAESRV